MSEKDHEMLMVLHSFYDAWVKSMVAQASCDAIWIAKTRDELAIAGKAVSDLRNQM